MNIEERINEGFRRLSQTAKDWSNPTPEETAAARHELARRREDGGTLLHGLARAGRLGEVAHLLTSDLLLMTASRGETPVHLAIESGYFDQIPADLLTTEHLTTSPVGNMSLPIRRLAQAEKLDQLIAKLPDMTDENAAGIAELIFREVPKAIQPNIGIIQALFERFPPKTLAIFMGHMFAA
jgi:hypothetical protein